jgi:hypothetical protein
MGAEIDVLWILATVRSFAGADGSKHRRDWQLLARLRQVAKLRHHACVEELAQHKPTLLLLA